MTRYERLVHALHRARRMYYAAPSAHRLAREQVLQRAFIAFQLPRPRRSEPRRTHPVAGFVMAWALASALILGALALCIGVDTVAWRLP